jgi:sulfide:quinone oxidoreductase
MGLRKLWELAGIGTISEGTRERSSLARHGIHPVHARIESIDPVAKRASAGGEVWEGDYLVVALGAERRPDLVPGLAVHAHDIWSKSAIPGARRALERLNSGRVLITVSGAPYPCPPAPYECAMLLDESFRKRGVRDTVEVATATLQPILMPNAGGTGSRYVADRLDERGIVHSTKRKLRAVDPAVAHFDDGDESFDLLLAVPPHRVPAVVADAGLTGESGWIEVDKLTLATGFEDVFAVGDVTMIKLANGLPLPKAGIIAEREGERVASAIAARLAGTAAPAAFAGEGVCFVETGHGSAAMVDGRFFAEPEPDVQLVPSSPDHAAAKRRFEAERLQSWFGG